MKNKFFSILKDVITTKAYAVRTFASDPLQAYKFRVFISGIPSSIGFKSIGGLSREVAVVEYLENMFDYTHKMPGRETVGEITFERGMYADKTLENAYKSIFKAASAVRRDVTINITDRYGAIRRTFQLAECWFSAYSFSDLDAESNDVIIETLTMQFENFL